jgi:hypothetical protein|tara:strand:- start:107 stop:673 length:567 start_codon:yes stop_codon:yes gene_type:complete
MFGRKKKITVNDKGFVPLTLQEAYVLDGDDYKIIRVDFETQDLLYHTLDYSNLPNPDSPICTELRGRTRTVGIEKNMMPQDDGKGIIRAGYWLAESCGYDFGSEVWLKRINPPIVNSITVKILDERTTDLQDTVQTGILSLVHMTPFVKGDKFTIPHWGERILAEIVEIENDEIDTGVVNNNTSIKIL